MKRKIVIIFMLVAALFVFVAIFKNIQMDNQELISSGNTETEPCVKNKVKKEGVYFRELQPEYEIKRFYYRPYTCYAYSTLYYNGRIYKSAMQVDEWHI
ncbi:MAG: hypothetical protein HFH68_05835 [Lachnospiraceae bacterium]|nr:hypothetical protein [Lachnospiraceae bacterium]